MDRRIVFAAAARKDIGMALAWSQDHFGIRAAAKYELLMFQAFQDLAADPTRAGSRKRPEIAQGVLTYHLSMSRKRVSGERVKQPRHFVLYRSNATTLNIARLLYDRFDLSHPSLNI